MIDLHTHILPELDDGSTDTGMTYTMLLEEKRQGVKCVVATPHFYAQKESLDSFLQRRDFALEKIAGLNGVPSVIAGAEVFYFEGISKTRLDSLCFEGTDAVLIEMPFEHWAEHTLREICDISGKGYIPVVAHVERYLSYHNSEALDRLFSEGVLFQSNVEFFTDKRTRKKAVKMLRQGKIQLIGSDCHNLTDRRVNIDEFLNMADRSDLSYIESNEKILFG